MIVVKLMDGLGNQMFQYAFGRYLQTVYQEPIVFETTKLKRKGSVRRLGLQELNIPLVEKNPGKNQCRFPTAVENNLYMGISKFFRLFAKKILGIATSGTEAYQTMIKYGFYTTEEPIAFYPFAKTKHPIKFVRGYFQSEKYFYEAADIIKAELKVNAAPNEIQRSLIHAMAEQDSVAIHIRRGDYLQHHKFNVCTENYYIQAVEKMNTLLENPIYYVFSNSEEDLIWIQRNYHLPCGKVHYIREGENELGDLRLMYSCRHHIISNSTFSWWGSYLGDYEEKVIIAPSRWYNGEEEYKDIYQDTWLVIDV